ncbi:hypothetical protein POM88_023152 [Heracleum sosnowskyi]|uniref:Uncharacterized protein n=1 Tax=Heracleum sosnowskyi TaxID=360622 RepID=A0AAD8IGF6_9APIA|nr:hypothetical protein POM88_023152 [Heracleum sosnowskyi]
MNEFQSPLLFLKPFSITYRSVSISYQMGKSSKKSASKVEVASAVVATKPLKKCVCFFLFIVPAKKQKQNESALKQTVAKKQADAKITKKSKKAESSSKDDSSLIDEIVVLAKVVKPAPKAKAASSSSEEESSSDFEEDEPNSKVPVKTVLAAKNGFVAAKKKDESSDESDLEFDESKDVINIQLINISTTSYNVLRDSRVNINEVGPDVVSDGGIVSCNNEAE